MVNWWDLRLSKLLKSNQIVECKLDHPLYYHNLQLWVYVGSYVSTEEWGGKEIEINGMPPSLPMPTNRVYVCRRILVTSEQGRVISSSLLQYSNQEEMPVRSRPLWSSFRLQTPRLILLGLLFRIQFRWDWVARGKEAVSSFLSRLTYIWSGDLFGAPPGHLMCMVHAWREPPLQSQNTFCYIIPDRSSYS
jgi:hypothetical protein